MKMGDVGKIWEDSFLFPPGLGWRLDFFTAKTQRKKERELTEMQFSLPKGARGIFILIVFLMSGRR